jgi:hypothetical protein
MKEFKNNSFADIAAFVDLSANEYGVKLAEKVTSHSSTFDGRYKIQRAMADRLAFDERMQAAKSFIVMQCLADWTEVPARVKDPD